MEISDVEYWDYYWENEHWHGQRTLDYELPWLTKDAINKIDDLLAGRYYNILEFGSGGSTLFLRNYAKHIVSFETNRDWYNKVNKKLEKYNNVEYYYTQNIEEVDELIDDRTFHCILVDSAYPLNPKRGLMLKYMIREEILKRYLHLLEHPKIIILDNYGNKIHYPAFHSIPKLSSLGLENCIDEKYDDKCWNGSGTRILYEGENNVRDFNNE